MTGTALTLASPLINLIHAFLELYMCYYFNVLN